MFQENQKNISNKKNEDSNKLENFDLKSLHEQADDSTEAYLSHSSAEFNKNCEVSPIEKVGRLSHHSFDSN